MNTQENSASNVARVEKTYAGLEVARIYTSDYQKEGTKTAELKQTVTTKSYYPTKSVSSNLSENVFDTKDFGFEEKEYERKSTRVAWVDVPANLSEEAIKAQFAKFPEATIQQTLANHPILSDKQKYAIEAGLTTKDIIADSQVLRYSKGSEQEGQIILDENTKKPMYRGLYFRTTRVEDVDLRTSDPEDFYASPAIELELGIAQSATTSQQGVM